MPDVTQALNLAASPTYSIDQILQATKPPSTGGGFRRVLGGLLGSVGNMFAPGMGGMIGGLISGGAGGMGGLGGLGGLGGSANGMMAESMQYLQLQQQMNQAQVVFETASAVMKCRHDAALAAVRNIQ